MAAPAHKKHEPEMDAQRSAELAELRKGAPLGEGVYRNVHRDIEWRPSKLGGYGLFAKKDIPKGSKVWVADKDYNEYTWAEIQAMGPEARELIMNFGYQVDEDSFGGPITVEEAKSDVSNYWNHSCDPTCWLVTEDYWEARRDIKAGEEMTADYATFDATLDRIKKCMCGTAKCRGAVHPNDWMRPDLQKEYEGHFMPYITARIRRSKGKKHYALHHAPK
jgi:hypothetical protein